MSAETKNVVNIIKLLASGVIVVLIAFGFAFLANAGISSYQSNNFDSQKSRVDAAIKSEEEAALKYKMDELATLFADYSKYDADLDAKISETTEKIKNLSTDNPAYQEYLQKLEAYEKNQKEYNQYLEKLHDYELKQAEYKVLEVMLQKHEAYYEYYTANGHANTREKRDYHYYGQFYEMFNHMYKANTIFLGSSRSVYGINPLYLENVESLEDYSFYNFSLNAAGPSYYLQWYDVFKKEANYPLPDTVVYCVDWFMFDEPWMWRSFNYDERSGGALDAIRNYMANTAATAANIELLAAMSEAEGTTDTGAQSTDPTNPGSSAEKKPEGVWGHLTAWWNGDIRPDLSSLANWFKDYVPLYANQDAFIDMIKYYAAGGASSIDAKIKAYSDEAYASLDEINASVAAELREKANEYNSNLAKKQSDYIKLLNQYKSMQNSSGNIEIPEVPELKEIPELPELILNDPYYDRAFPEEELSKDYSKRDLPDNFCVDKDGNIASLFYKGFIPWEAEYGGGNAEGSGDQYKNDSPNKVKNSNYEIESFKELILLMQHDGINVVLISLPDYEFARPSSKIWENTAIIADIAEDLGVQFYNYNYHDISADMSSCPNYHDLSITGLMVAAKKNYYSNWNHLNGVGAKKFTQQLAKDLAAIIKGEDLDHN